MKNLARVFGTYIGCVVRIKYKFEGKIIEKRKTLKGVRVLGDSKTNIDVLGSSYDSSYCKLILKNLSTITEDDKREIQELFFNEHGVVKKVYLTKNRLVVIDTANKYREPLNPTEIMWLCSKGYDVGIVPNEYKIII